MVKSEFCVILQIADSHSEILNCNLCCVEQASNQNFESEKVMNRRCEEEGGTEKAAVDCRVSMDLPNLKEVSSSSI